MQNLKEYINPQFCCFWKISTVSTIKNELFLNLMPAIAIGCKICDNHNLAKKSSNHKSVE